MNKPTAQNVQNIFNRQQTKSVKAPEYAGVGQDKNALARERVAAGEVVTARTSSQTRPAKPLQTKSSTKRKRTYVMLWVEPVVKSELTRRAEQNGLSISATGSALLKRALRENIDSEYGALLEPIIRQEIRRQMRTFSSRIALLLVRVAFAAEQTRNLVTNILARQPGVKPDVLDNLLDSSANAAKSKITAKTPQLQRIITEVENWFREPVDGKEEKG